MSERAQQEVDRLSDELTANHNRLAAAATDKATAGGVQQWSFLLPTEAQAELTALIESRNALVAAIEDELEALRVWLSNKNNAKPDVIEGMLISRQKLSYLVDGVRCGELPRSYHLKQLLALRRQAFEELQVYDAEIEMLLDGDSREQEILRRVSDCPRYDCVEDSAHRATMKHDKTGDWILFDNAIQAVESVTKGDSHARP